MPIYTLTLTDREEIARDTFLFKFNKPENFNFKPGQYGGFTLINPSETDAGGITRRFSLLCTPNDPYIAIAMRMQASAYKRVLRTVELGSPIKFAGPTGNFVLDEEGQTPVVLIAGGIGITPFYCMIRDAMQHQASRQITLFYGNQSRQDAAFMDEFTALARDHSNFHFVPTLSNPDGDWQGACGYISAELLSQHIKDLYLPIYYICGGAAMVNALRETLEELEIPGAQVRVEDFPGY